MFGGKAAKTGKTGKTLSVMPRTERSLPNCAISEIRNIFYFGVLAPITALAVIA